MNDAEAATCIVGFLITGAFCDLIEMVALFPVRNVTAADLHGKTVGVIKHLEEAGFRVNVVITDNHKKTHKLFSFFCLNCGSQESFHWIPHPSDSSRKLFLLLDPVHILKCLRNNWLIQGALLFPDPREFFIADQPISGKLCCAKWSHLTTVYTAEQQSSLKSTRLNAVSVAPNSLERQNVNHVLKVFCEDTARGMEFFNKFSKHPGVEDLDETVMFIDLVVRLWRMWNIRHSFQYIRYRSPEMEPFKTVDDTRFGFMENFVRFVERWEELVKSANNKRKYSLTVDTTKALLRTSRGLMDLIKYLLQSNQVNYILTGKKPNFHLLVSILFLAIRVILISQIRMISA